jgi:hypothetical protein
MTTRRTRRSAAVAAVGVGLLAVSAGNAYAFWTTSGTGTGSAAAATLTKTLEITAVGAAPSGLFPTGSVTGTMRVTNPHPFAVTLTGAGIPAPSFATATVSGVTGCTGSTVSFVVTGQSATRIAAGGNATIDFRATMDNAAENTCQGGTFSSALTVSAQSTS